MGVYLTARLPSTYQEVEYIQSSGTQYIDAGLTPSNNTKVQFRLSNYSINSSIQYVFGSTSRWGNNMFGLLGTTSRSGDTINGHLLYNTSEYKLSSGNIGDGGAHVGELSSNGFYVDGTRIGAVSGVFSGTLNMTIFAGNINGIIGKNEKGAFKLYYFKVYESGTLVRDFVPCYRKSDDVIGLYDLVNNQFYTNSGTGIFSKGADVTAVPLKNAYIGEYNPQGLLSNIIAYYPMQGNLNDTSGNGYNLTTTKGSYTSGDYYNTMSNRIGHNASATYNSSASITISIWLNSSYSYALVCLGDNSIASQRGMQIRNGLAYVVVNGSAYNTTTVTTPSGFKMLSAVFDYSARTLKYYINGVLQATKSSIGSGSLRSSSRIIVGNNSYSESTGVTGDLGIIAITQNAMSATDLLDFYNYTKSQYGL